MPEHELTDFPYNEIRDRDGDYFPTREIAGFDDDQIWSVTETDGTFCYGPPHHYVNLIGYVATRERHDHNTYFEEEITYDG